jgi:hypothetical protein
MTDEVLTTDPPQDESSPREIEGDVTAQEERGRSTIGFPYAWLADAERIAQELHNFGGMATPDGIANGLGQKSGSGAFRQKLSAARIFGLVTTRPNQVSLTRLGRNIIDPERQATARVEAFKSVPLYRAILDKYQGDLLPPTATLDAEIARLGVSPKQTSTARQIMFRSAERAGFFARGANRLVEPDGSPEPRSGEPQRRDWPRRESGSSLPSALENPILAMLNDGESWSPEQTHDYVDGLRKMHRALAEQ